MVNHVAPKGRRITIRDVAAQLGLSTSTVSAALNGGGTIGQATRERVQATAAELGYRPSRSALALRLGRTGTIAYSLPNIDDGDAPVFDVAGYMVGASAAASAAFGAGYALTLTPPHLAADADWSMLGADGVVVCDPVRGDERLATLERLGIPVVTIERDTSRPDWSYMVTADYRSSIRGLLDHLREQGARRIALLAPDASWSSTDDELAGYREWMAEQGQPENVRLIPAERVNLDGYADALALLSEHPRPDALVASVEQYRPGVLRACRELGIRVPQDLLLALGGDSQAAENAHPSITAIDYLPARQSELAVQMLLRRIEGQPISGPTISETVLRIRESTRRGR